MASPGAQILGDNTILLGLLFTSGDAQQIDLVYILTKLTRLRQTRMQVYERKRAVRRSLMVMFVVSYRHV